MTKGHRVTARRSDDLLGSYNYGYGYGYVPDVSVASELGEDDVWAAVDVVGEDDVPPGDHRHGNIGLGFEEDSQTWSRRRRGGDDGMTMDSPRGQHHGLATSAPVDVPDWDKIYRVSSVESLLCPDETWMEDRDRDYEIVPPHEYLAREYARSRKSAADSVLEGVGRTLKGRDMRRVRDALWRQTGFAG